MVSRRKSLLSAVGVALVAAGGLSGCAAQPQGAVVEGVEILVATIESVDQAARRVVLRVPQGLVTVQAGPEVRNFAQLRAGDRVRVGHYRAVAVQLRPAGPAPAQPLRELGAARAAPGDRPGLSGVEAVRLRVKVDAVDRERAIVTFTGNDGMTRTVAVREPAMRDFVRGLRPGDDVEIDMVDAIAVSVEPMPG